MIAHIQHIAHMFKIIYVIFIFIDNIIYIFRWAFMELLGFVAFFGILLVVADSYRLELVMCVLTVFSISAFVYILGDLDHAYHGTFRVDLGVFVVYLRDLEGQYDVVRVSGSKISSVEVQEVN